MSRRDTSFKYLPGRSAEKKQFEASPTSSCKSFTSLISHSSDSSITASRRNSRYIDLDSNLHQKSLSQSVRYHEGGKGGVVQLQMTEREVGVAGGSGERRGLRESSIRGNGGMPSLMWSDGSYSVPRLAKDFASTKRFPVIVKVTQGYYGDGRLKLPVGQVLQVYATCEELRVRAIDGAGRQLSLPLSHVQSMEVQWSNNNAPDRPPGTTNNVGTSGSGCMKLGDVLREATLPVTVSVLKTMSRSSNCSSSRADEEGKDASTWNDLSLCSFPFGAQLTVQSFYNCTYLLANVIENGWLDSSSIVTIPEDLRPRFSLALGLKDATPEEWKDFTGMFDRAARHIKFSAVKGYNGVIYEDWSEFSMTCASEKESNPPPLVEIERYLINKKQLPQSTASSSSSSSPSLQSDNNNYDYSKRFPKTSPHLGNRKTTFVPSSSTSSYSSCSILPAPPSTTTACRFAGVDSQSLSSLDSAGMMSDLLSSRTVSGTSGTSGFVTEVLQDSVAFRTTLSESSEPDYANIDGDDPSDIHIVIGMEQTSGGRQGDVLLHRRGFLSDPQRNDVAHVEDIALEDLSLAQTDAGVKCGSRTGDNRGTLVSIDEGYSTKDSNRSCVKADATLATSESKKRYSPVYF